MSKETQSQQGYYNLEHSSGEFQVPPSSSNDDDGDMNPTTAPNKTTTKTTSKKKKTKTTTNDNKKEKSVVETLEEQVSRAELAVRKNEFKVQTLHQQWITYLVRLSYMVMLLAFHQMQNPSTACLQDVKQFNANAVQGDTKPISGWQAVGLVLTDSLVHILAIVMSCFLSFFLQKQQTALKRRQEQSASWTNKKDDDDHGDAKTKNKVGLDVDPRLLKKQALFSDGRYMVANACIAPLLALYFAHRNLEPSMDSCLDGHLLQRAEIEPVERQRSLPVVVVYHVLVTACVWFMDQQQDQVSRHVLKVYQLRRDLLVAQEEEEENKKNKKTKQTVSKKN